MKDILIVIPSLDPDERLISYVKSLHEHGFEEVLVVDDGSGPSYGRIFDLLDPGSGDILLKHETNRGKGAALKTAYSWIMKNRPDILGIITADSDGQHTVGDCLKMSERFREDHSRIYLGARDFDLPYIPPKSRGGNKLTAALFRLLYGTYIPDTQTGLRAFGADLLPFMTDVPGERYEYEMNVVISCVRAGLTIESVPIETVYENNNECTHFHPVRDSVRIYRVLFGNFIKFMGSSLISALLDQGLFNLFNRIVFHNATTGAGKYIFISTALARVISSVFNFTLNKNLVFDTGKKGKPGRSFIRYALLCVFIMLMSALGTWGLDTVGLDSAIAKLIVDTVLYFVSYRLQQRWVFNGQ